MKRVSSLGRSLVLLLCLCLVDEGFAQRRNRNARQSHNDRKCPENTKCVEYSRCRPSLLRYLGHPPQNCGLTYHGKQRICCPERPFFSPRTPRVTARPTPPKPVTQETPVATYRPPNGQQECGKVNGLQGFVIGGKEAKQGAWPWMVAIFMRDRYGIFTHKCTGAMITRRHVLSAAHCFKRKEVFPGGTSVDLKGDHWYELEWFHWSDWHQKTGFSGGFTQEVKIEREIHQIF
ncbi:Proclotting enzyme like protein [Argiope bruennichi]|uniref:Proclotting enzyme like protein n=1 Tax=Argiope bruennichi TaxID=94029 RepID=A0A8T0F015_ARGBR|nr:Proclotting enzyme like protein [Argiope bruennichi]